MSINSISVEAAANAGAIPQPPSQDDSLAGLTKFIPTESITLYVSAVSAQKALQEYAGWLTPSMSYKIVVVLTPILMLILFLRQLAVAGAPWKVPPSKWPIWRMIASTIAFAAWATAVPGNPVVDPASAAGGVVAAFLALFVSLVLNLLSPFFEKRLPPTG